MSSLAAELRDLGAPGLDQQLAHPTVAGLARGDLDPDVFRRWLEQDYVFLLDYVRVFSRLAWQAPDEHLGDLVDLASETFHGELDLHRRLSAGFGADLEGATAGPACAAYTRFLLDAAADYGTGLAALYPCMWGYSTLGQRLAASSAATSGSNRYQPWIDTYADPGFAALADRIGQMLDEAAPDPDAARHAFLTAMDHELAFWDVPS
jgi:thiaminase/transcriptional activator TenA